MSNITKYYQQPKIQSVSAIDRRSTTKYKRQIKYAVLVWVCLFFIFSLLTFYFELFPPSTPFYFMLYSMILMFWVQFHSAQLVNYFKKMEFLNDFQELKIEGESNIDFLNAEKIWFVFLGEPDTDTKRNPLRRLITDQAHRPIHVDHMKIDREIYYFQIQSNEDKINYFNFINQLHFFNKKTKLIIGRDEIPLPVNPNQKFILNENQQLLRNELDH